MLYKVVSFHCTAEVHRLCIYIHPPFLRLPSRLGHHRALSGALWAVWQVLISYLFIQSSVYMSISNSQFTPLPQAYYFCFLIRLPFSSIPSLQFIYSYWYHLKSPMCDLIMPLPGQKPPKVPYCSQIKVQTP